MHTYICIYVFVYVGFFFSINTYIYIYIHIYVCINILYYGKSPWLPPSRDSEAAAHEHHTEVGAVHPNLHGKNRRTRVLIRAAVRVTNHYDYNGYHK